MKSPIKIRPTVRRAVWGAGIAAAALAVIGSNNAFAALVQPFTQGNIAVERVGDGGAALSGSANSIFFDEFAPTGLAQTPVQSIAIPNSGGLAMVEGSSSANGEMTLAANGQFICFPGGATNLANTVSLTSATAAQVPRAVGILNANAAYSMIITSSVAFSGGSLRGVVSDGNNNFWGSGTATGVGGIYYFGLTSVSNDIYSGNLRCSAIYNGSLWYSTGSGTPGIGIWEFSGTPTVTNALGNTATKIFTTTASPYNFSVSPDGNTIFYADDSGGISKLTKSGGVFSLAYILFAKGCYGLMVDWSTSPATVYATTGSGAANNALIKLSDTGAGAIPVTNALAGANRMYRNLSFTPTNSAFVALAPSITGISPTNLTVNIGGTATFSLFGFTGNPIASNQWYKISGGTTNLLGTQTGQSLVLNSVALSDTASYFAIITNASGSATSSVVNLTVTASPSITSIAPLTVATNAGSTVVYTLTANLGTPVANIFWYKISNSVPLITNLIAGATTTNLTLLNVTTNDQANYYAVLTNLSGSATSAIVSLTITNFPPVITSITPLSITTNAGSTVTFTVANTGTPPFTYLWYKETATTTNLIPSATNATLTLVDVLASDIASYQVIITNASPLTATSAVVTLSVTNDPHIGSQPANTFGLLDGTIYFSVGVVGTTPNYQWYYSDGAGNLTAPVVDGNTTLSGVSTISGSASSTLQIANLQFADLPGLTNLLVVVTNVYGGAVTSSVAALLGINTSGSVLAFWDFNGSEFTNTVVNPNSLRDPVSYLGAGTTLPVGSVDTPGTSPFSGSIDNNNGPGFESFPAYVYPQGFPDHAPAFSWGSSAYPVATNGNKQNGVQFNVSTAGAKNIRFSYESRVSATASDYERVQYTTNGTDWIDYPTSSTFGGVGTTYLSYSNDLTGFPGVANNPNFGVRIVTEYESTATYGVGTTNSFVGTANAYGTSGTVTYDVVTFFGDAITNNNAAPVVAGFVDTNTLDYVPVTNTFTVSDDTTPVNSLTYSAVSLDSSGIVNPTFAFTGSGATRSLIITPNTIPVSVAAAPILVTITDGNGDSTVVSFLLTLTSSNLPPTNSLASLKGTNTLANAVLTIPFTVGDDHTPASALTDFSVASDNNTLIPAANIVIGNAGTANPTVTITPAHNQLGVGLISVSLNDDDALEPKITTATIPFTVRPNTNVVAIDYFDYDSSGALDSVSAGFWTHLSGNFGQLKVGIDSGLGAPNTARIDASAFTENLQTALLGAPYKTNTGAILYASYTINLPDTTKMPLNNGTYVTAFNDGSGATADVECCLVVSTNNATPGFYRLGIGNVVGATALTSVQFTNDLAPATTYVVVTALSVSNGFSTLWVNPESPTSPSVTDTTAAASPTNLYNMVNFELRESGQPNGGQVNIGSLKVGTTFDSVFPLPHVQIAGTNAIVTWSDPTLGIQSTTNLTVPFTDITGATTPYTNGASTNSTLFFRLGQ